jgi:hypothetical protein
MLLLPLLLTACSGAGQSTPTLAAGVFYVAPDGDDANPGTLDAPWATIGHAADVLQAGEMVYVRQGTYAIAERIRPKHSGSEDAWIVYAGYPGEQAVIDASDIEVGPPGSASPYPHDQGAFLIQNVGYVRVQNLTLKNSYSAGFTVRDSHHVDLINNTVDTTFASGIAVWDTDHKGQECRHIKVIGNTVVHANRGRFSMPWYDGKRETPHEAISIGGAVGFEVAYNHVYDCDKEGIDVKETSRQGTVHHNHVHNVDRQGLYVDSWFGVLEDAELYENVVHDCRGAGIVVSVEGGQEARDIRIHHNLVYDNLGTGIFFSRWGDGPRSDVQVYNNTVHHNGYGPPAAGEDYFWMTGGLYLFSTNLQDIEIRNNILSDNRGFQIGYSDHYLRIADDVETVLRQKNIVIEHNLLYDQNDVEYPIHAGWPPDNYADIYAIAGANAVQGDPLFVDSRTGSFYLRSNSPAIDRGKPGSAPDPDGSPNDIGAFFVGAEQELWWQEAFPPQFEIE